jgi:(p)ppGpp synthase/HD superfamily hydrolase
MGPRLAAPPPRLRARPADDRLQLLAAGSDDGFAATSRLLVEAYGFARDAHAGQYHQADGTPYIEHPLAVGRLLHAAGCEEQVVAAGLLHDVIEDTPATLADVRARFGTRVTRLVAAMTEQPRLHPFEVRKAAHRQTIARAGRDAKAIYAADKVVNVFTLRAAIRRRGRRDLGRRLAGKLDSKLDHYEATLRLLERESPPLPFTRLLRTELERLRTECATGSWRSNSSTAPC